MKIMTRLASLMLAAVLLLALCACGENKGGNAGTDTGESVIYTDGSSGFDFTAAYDQLTDQTGYSITGFGTCTDEEVVVPQGRKDSFGEVKPFLWDDNNGFRGMEQVRNIKLPEGFLEIRSGFGYSPQLETVIIPSTVRKIGGTDDSRIFENCPALKEVIFGGTTEQWNAIEKGKNWKTGAVSFVVRCSNNLVSE